MVTDSDASDSEDEDIFEKSHEYSVRVEDVDPDDPAIVESMETEPQPSTSGLQIHTRDSDNDSDHEGQQRESDDDSEMLSDSAFIERNVRARWRPVRRRERGRRGRQRSSDPPRRRSGESDLWQETDSFVPNTYAFDDGAAGIKDNCLLTNDSDMCDFFLLFFMLMRCKL